MRIECNVDIWNYSSDVCTLAEHASVDGAVQDVIHVRCHVDVMLLLLRHYL